ncbi:NPCBM/NEW2 domain-containing protein [Kitasatospora sp. NPDC094015]|uniref:NPCBM/NEW2 domain-containing protein n=1 Tax=Kitasatospora sp. NPDC094015 TaxID=3155205 RepID=UPI0033344A4F
MTLGSAGLSAALAPAAVAATTSAGAVTAFSAAGSVYSIAAGTARARVSFTTDRVFRIELAPTGTFTDPTGSDIVLPQDAPPATSWRDAGDHYEISTAQLTLRVYKAALRFALYRADGSQVWSEAKPLSWDGRSTTQTLTRGATEQFFGAGEQNGSFTHRGRTVQVGQDTNWNEGGHPNSVPFYLSSAGYGVFRNTYAPGSYAFTDPVATTEQELRFDAYYFAGPSTKDVIGQYTSLTGKPFLPPIYGLEMGDSDCYLHNANRGERHTLDALKVADGYVQNDMPNGWMLVNDGYGCGYENLAQTAQGLQQRSMQLGLWTENGLDRLADQVRAGQRIAKLDVAWVGSGYKFALDGCKAAYQGIEANSDARGFTWAPESWSGAQRCGVQWSGDQSGSWDYIRWQIPTYAGATMSGMAYDTGDVDGIFGGSAKTYTRDLEWKSFLPAVMSMDGWAPSDKQPYRYGDPYTAINRKYLKLKESLLPYMYSYAAEAARTGVGPVRPLALEYPDDPVTATDAVKYEFLSGEDFLVAPVYADTSLRDGIYLPKGTWVDYWTGRTYQGPTTVNGYQAPLDTLPLFVKAGAAVPMWPGVNSYRDRTAGSPLAWDVYPQGHSSFSLYEDDGVTREHRSGRYATQTATVDAPTTGTGQVRIGLSPSTGDFTGKQIARPYRFAVHSTTAPTQVALGGRALPRFTSKAALDAAAEGWWYDPADRGGVVDVKTAALSTAGAVQLVLDGASAVEGGSGPTDPGGPRADSWASDLPWADSVNGWGPAERDRSNGEQGAADGHPLTLNGTTYPKGIGAHAASDIGIVTGGHCSSFTASVGIDDEINGYGDVTFSVRADGATLWTSPTLTSQSAPLAVDVPLGAAQRVDLVVSSVGTATGDHGDWGAPRFHCS